MGTVGIKDVAERAGVSVGTVSNALNRPGSVRSSTRAKVERAMVELGFVRNESARQLRAGKSRLLAYVVPDVGNPFFTDIARGAEGVAQAAGLALVLCDADSERDREDGFLELLLEQRVHGVLITPIDAANPRLVALADRGVPVVLVDRVAAPGDILCSVGVDDVEGGRLAAEHLIAQGHERIAFVGSPNAMPQVADRYRGAVDATREGADGEILLLDSQRLDVESGRLAAQRLLGIPERRRPTAAFCANDLLALGMLQALTGQGHVVPDEIALVGYDDIEFAAAAAVPLSSVRQPRRELGRLAVTLLLDDAGREGGHQHEHPVLRPELVVRASSSTPPLVALRRGLP